MIVAVRTPCYSQGKEDLSARVRVGLLCLAFMHSKPFNVDSRHSSNSLKICWFLKCYLWFCPSKRSAYAADSICCLNDDDSLRLTGVSAMHVHVHSIHMQLIVTYKIKRTLFFFNQFTALPYRIQFWCVENIQRELDSKNDVKANRNISGPENKFSTAPFYLSVHEAN